jgi:hypothetical protein
MRPGVVPERSNGAVLKTALFGMIGKTPLQACI